ncbi:hypothetical protein ACVWY0_001639 [Arthrobacter sp. UYNi723]
MTKTQTTAKTTTTEKATVQCTCGCGEATQSAKSLYRPGHDARHAGLVARDLVASRQEGYERQYSEEDLGSDALRAKAVKMAERLTAKAQAQADRAAAKGSKWTEAEPVKRGRWIYPTRTNGKVTQINDRRDGSGNWTAL